MTTPNCGKCNAPMEDGFVYGNDQHGGAVTPTEWVEGAPQRSFWRGLQTTGLDHHTVVTYRCPSCGYLEAYAPAS